LKRTLRTLSATTRQALSPILLLLVAAELGHLATGIVPGWENPSSTLASVAKLFFCLFCIVGLTVCSFREWALLCFAAVLTIILAPIPDAKLIFTDALGLASFFGVFIAMVTIMKEAASRSRSVAEVGIFLTSQPPGRRFYSMAVGSHVLGTFLNFSAVSLISPLIQKGARASTTEPTADLERRQLSALLRGFSWILLWAPTTLTQAVLLKLFVDVDYSQLLLLGIGSSILMIGIGRLVDRLEWRRTLPATPQRRIDVPVSSIWVVATVCGLLIAGTFLTKSLTGFSVAESLIFVAPTITIGWLIVQKSATRSIEWNNDSAESPTLVMWGAAPDLTRSAIALGLSGYIGRVAANILPTADIALWISPSDIPGWVFLAILPVLITLGGQIALSPIVFVVFLGETITAFPALPANPTHIVFALSVGWALSMTASPNATATLLISATCNIPPTTLTWKWNGRYALACYLVFVGIFYLLSL